mmetsp:Transcript_27788/g.60906  ORF Transcript_27788/g.60906 Transcript_27788/m.60906 type:complete len:120 (-) Transcript_27788:148-507(-)
MVPSRVMSSWALELVTGCVMSVGTLGAAHVAGVGSGTEGSGSPSATPEEVAIAAAEVRKAFGSSTFGADDVASAPTAPNSATSVNSHTIYIDAYKFLPRPMIRDALCLLRSSVTSLTTQ